MRLSKAVGMRIQEIADESGLSVQKITSRCGVSPSIVYVALRYKCCPNLQAIRKICKTAGITVTEFFNSPLFEDVSD